METTANATNAQETATGAVVAGGAGAQPLRLGSNNITVSMRKERISVALQPWRESKSLAYRHKGLALKLAAVDSLDPDRRQRAGQWHLQRSEGMARPVVERLGRCGRYSVDVLDTTTGEVKPVKIGCGDSLCADCRKRRARKVARRLRSQLDGIDRWQRQAHKRRGRLWTLTLRDSRNPGTDALVMRDAWTLFRARWRDHYGWSFAFLRYEELSHGRAGQGHNHWHALAWHHPVGRDTLSRWQGWWRTALATAGARHQPGHDYSGNFNLSSTRGGSEVAATYTTKVYQYVCKEAFDLESLDTQRAAEYIAALYGRRRFTTSRGLLQKTAGPSQFVALAIHPTTPGRDGGADDGGASVTGATTGPPSG